jgi:hypothetical protein
MALMGARKKPAWLAVAALAMILALLWFLTYGWADSVLWLGAIVLAAVAALLMLVRAARGRRGPGPPVAR